jgi:hypothetical protein
VDEVVQSHMGIRADSPYYPEKFSALVIRVTVNNVITR